METEKWNLREKAAAGSIRLRETIRWQFRKWRQQARPRIVWPRRVLFTLDQIKRRKDYRYSSKPTVCSHTSSRCHISAIMPNGPSLFAYASLLCVCSDSISPSPPPPPRPGIHHPRNVTGSKHSHNLCSGEYRIWRSWGDVAVRRGPAAEGRYYTESHDAQHRQSIDTLHSQSAMLDTIWYHSQSHDSILYSPSAL